jgi:nitroreductase
MVLAAWNEGIGSSPNSARDREAVGRLLDLTEEESVATIISLGYPQHPWRPRADDVDGILRRIKRKPLEELVVWLDR